MTVLDNEILSFASSVFKGDHFNIKRQISGVLNDKHSFMIGLNLNSGFGLRVWIWIVGCGSCSSSSFKYSIDNYVLVFFIVFSFFRRLSTSSTTLCVSIGFYSIFFLYWDQYVLLAKVEGNSVEFYWCVYPSISTIVHQKRSSCSWRCTILPAHSVVICSPYQQFPLL
jgi:hypothetical protein